LCQYRSRVAGTVPGYIRLFEEKGNSSILSGNYFYIIFRLGATSCRLPVRGRFGNTGVSCEGISKPPEATGCLASTAGNEGPYNDRGWRLQNYNRMVVTQTYCSNLREMTGGVSIHRQETGQRGSARSGSARTTATPRGPGSNVYTEWRRSRAFNCADPGASLRYSGVVR